MLDDVFGADQAAGSDLALADLDAACRVRANRVALAGGLFGELHDRVRSRRGYDGAIMPARHAALTLILPGLSVVLADARVRLPALEQLIARGNGMQSVERAARSPLYPWQQDAIMTLGLHADNFPSAPTSWLGLGQAPAAGTLLHVTAVHMEATAAGLTMRAVEPWSAEEWGLVEPALQSHCERAGFAWRRLTSDGVFLSCADDLEVSCAAPASVGHQELRAMQPQGRDARRLIQLQAELQMLLHEHPVHARRIAQQQAPINALWLWGAGGWPIAASCKPTLVYSNESYLRGVCSTNQIEHCDAPASLADIVPVDGDTMAVASLTRAEEVEERFFAPLLRALRHGAWRSVQVLWEEGRFDVTRRQLWRFWRRPRPLEELLA